MQTNKHKLVLMLLWSGSSQVTLMPEEAEDMWHTYNLLQMGDSLRASTIRYPASKYMAVLST